GHLGGTVGRPAAHLGPDLQDVGLEEIHRHDRGSETHPTGRRGPRDPVPGPADVGALRACEEVDRRSLVPSAVQYSLLIAELPRTESSFALSESSFARVGMAHSFRAG